MPFEQLQSPFIVSLFINASRTERYYYRRNGRLIDSRPSDVGSESFIAREKAEQE